MTLPTINLLPQRLSQKADEAFRLTVDQFGDAAQDGFDRADYGWPGITKRRSGGTAGTTRDVVDLGLLKGSQTPPERVKFGHYRITWDADYAAAVFLGAVFKKRRGSLPARNVPMNVLREFDLPAVFAQEWKK